MQRCPWLPPNKPVYETYHDEEWGVPVYDDRVLFEFIVLESAQAGLSWETVLNKRENYRKHFHNFVPQKVAKMTQADIDRIIQDPGVIRHRRKLETTITNAQAFLKIAGEWGSFSNYLWHWVDRKPIVNHWKKLQDIPAVTDLAKAIAKDMKKRGFIFFGPTICYAYLQAVGVVNDHTMDCFRYGQI